MTSVSNNYVSYQSYNRDYSMYPSYMYSNPSYRPFVVYAISPAFYLVAMQSAIIFPSYPQQMPQLPLPKTTLSSLKRDIPKQTLPSLLDSLDLKTLKEETKSSYKHHSWDDDSFIEEKIKKIKVMDLKSRFLKNNKEQLTEQEKLDTSKPYVCYTMALLN